jgi:hypothetical protein
MKCLYVESFIVLKTKYCINYSLLEFTNLHFRFFFLNHGFVLSMDSRTIAT